MIPCRKISLVLTAWILALLKRADSSQTANCLGQDVDINNVLTSTHPPFDNYYNISRAVFTSTASSLYIRIRVKFVSDRGVKIQLYTWSKSCLYVATEYISLFAMNWYSVGAILPNRRQSELYITLPELCSNLTDENNGSDSKMFYFLSTLEDVAMKPKVLEPQLNTVECVVKGHTNFTKDIFDGVNYYMLVNICWCIWVISLVTAFVSSLLINTWLDFKSPNSSKDSKFKKRAAVFLFSVLFVLELVIACVAVSGISSNTYPVVFLISVIALPFLFSFMYVKKEPTNNRSKKELLVDTLRAAVVFDSLFMTSHHLIWILLGVISEPFWAIPVLVVTCSFCFSVYVLVFHHCKAFAKCNWLAVALSIAVILVLLLFFLITGVVSQSFLSNSLVSGLIQSALAIVASAWLNYLKNKINIPEQNTGSEGAGNWEGGDTKDGMDPAGDFQAEDLLSDTSGAAAEETELKTFTSKI